MDSQTYNQLVSFIWGIANDCLVDTYDVGDYRKVILPMTVIRRFDAVLENTKEAVKAERDRLKAEKWKDMDGRLCIIAGEAFCNYSDHTLGQMTAITTRAELKKAFIAYLDGFSKNVQDIIDKFGFRGQIDKLSNSNTLGILIQKFVDQRINLSNRPMLNDDGSIKLPALDNHTMGMVFEEVIRRFNEETNVTDAGRHFTPRDIVQLMADLAFIPVQDIIKAKNDTYTIYDGACGTGGMLTVGEERILEIAKAGGKKASIHIFGQENAEETYAIARSDMLLKGAADQAAEQADNIKFGSTISNDKFRGKTFNFMLSNPPFGTPWKKELDSDEWGGIKKDEISDTRFVLNYDGGEYRVVPDVDDPQMLFLANNVSKMKKANGHISRIIEVHSGSSLFTGKAGQGSTNLRRYIIERDMLEAIIALPEKMFYNTKIGTYLWVLTCKKTDIRRKGKVQLINATSLKSAFSRNIGEKNGEITEQLRKQIMDIYTAFDGADSEYSIVLDNTDFGYYSVPILRPLYDEDGKPLIQTKGKNKGKVVVNRDLSDTEIVPLNYPGGVEAFVENEVKPYAADVWYEEDSIKIGYEIRFTRYFPTTDMLGGTKPVIEKLRQLETVLSDPLDFVCQEPYQSYKELEEIWISKMPEHWKAIKLKRLFAERVEKGYPDEPMLVASKYQGVVPKSLYNGRTVEVSKDFHLMKLVRVGDFVISLRSFQSGIEYAYYQGIISAAYTILIPNDTIDLGYFRHFAKSRAFIELLKLCVTGIREGQNINYEMLKNVRIPVPPIEEQQQISAYLDSISARISACISVRKKEIELLERYKKIISSETVTGKIDIRNAKIPNFAPLDDLMYDIEEGMEDEDN